MSIDAPSTEDDAFEQAIIRSGNKLNQIAKDGISKPLERNYAMLENALSQYVNDNGKPRGIVDIRVLPANNYSDLYRRAKPEARYDCCFYLSDLRYLSECDMTLLTYNNAPSGRVRFRCCRLYLSFGKHEDIPCFRSAFVINFRKAFRAFTMQYEQMAIGDKITQDFSIGYTFTQEDREKLKGVSEYTEGDGLFKNDIPISDIRIEITKF